MINDPMTREMLDAHIRAGDLEVYTFDNKTDAATFDSRELKLSGILARKAIAERQLSKNPTIEQYVKQVNDFQSQYDAINNLTGTRYVPETMRGGMKTRRKRRFRNRLRRKTNRRR
jgi:hypothetical protein